MLYSCHHLKEEGRKEKQAGGRRRTEKALSSVSGHVKAKEEGKEKYYCRRHAEAGLKKNNMSGRQGGFSCPALWEETEGRKEKE